MSRTSDVIIGMGEIGKGLYKIIDKVDDNLVFGLDLDERNSLVQVSDIENFVDIAKISVPVTQIKEHTRVLHICIPGELRCFVDIVRMYIKDFGPLLTMIHSTVPVGTTRRVAYGGLPVVHSPVRGKHPKMDEGIRAYTKYVGGLSKYDIKFAVQVLDSYGLNGMPMGTPEATEIAKILSTTRYGVNLIFADMQKELLDSMGLDYTRVVKDWERSYNLGLDKVNMPQYKRPVLDPPNGYIGGHCVYENSKILRDMVDGPLRGLLNTIILYGRRNDDTEQNIENTIC